MTTFKCKICGGTLDISPEMAAAAVVGTCQYCGTTMTLPRINSDKRANLYDRANACRRANDYDRAMGIYETILSEDSADAEACWSLALCKYGVEYVEDPKTRKRIITCNRTRALSIFDDHDYQEALVHAEGEAKALYEEDAAAIDAIQRGILDIAGHEDPFDVFICYKENDDRGRRTADSVTAQELYDELTGKGYKVFFSRITLEDKLGESYEPYIYGALTTARVMAVIGSSAEYFESVWVKNEWSRFLALVREGAKKTLIPVCRDARDLPPEFARLQAQDMDNLGFMQDLVRGIEKIIPKKKKKTAGEAAADFPSLEGVLIYKPVKLDMNAGSGAIAGPAGEPGNFLVIPSAARSIAPGAFRELDGLLNITIEKGMLREIPEYAFAGCKDLEMLISSEGLRTIGREAFAGCAKLTVINLPEGLAAIGDRAFAGCGASEGIYLPLGLKSLGDGAFAGCGARHVAIDTLSSMGEGVFANCVQLEELYYHKDNVRSIGRNAFSGCVSLKDISFPEKLKTIEEGAFSGCAAITKLDFPDGLRTIGKNAFSGCAGLKNILFPEFFNTVEEGAFSGCAALESMTIPADMSAAPDSFFGCVNVKNINIDGEQKIGPLGWLAPLFEGRKPNIRFNNKSDRLGVNTIADGAFQGCDFLPKGFYQKIYSYKRIGKNAFAGLTKLTEMSFSTRLETIDEGAFAGCVNLTTLVFEENDRNPSRLSAIGARAFAGCAALECVRIPKAVASIGEDAFADCPNLKVIYISGKTEELYRKGAITINHPAVTFSEEDYLRAFRAKITELSQKTLRYGDTRFYSGVKEIRIPNDMEHISGSFEGCTSLKSLSIPKNIETIGRHAFKGCTGIKTLVLPAARIKIEEGAFEGCTALESITFRKNPEGLEIDRHRRAGIEKEAFKGCTSLKSIHFPGFFGFIEEGAFMGCAALEKISFSERENPLHDRPLEEYLGKDAFADCAALREVEAADGWFLTGDTEKLSGIFRNTPFLEKQTGFREEMHSQGRCVYCGGKVKYFSKKCETCGRENGEPVNVQLIAGFGIILVPAAIAAVVLMLTGMMPVEYLNRMISSVFPVLIPVFIFIFIKILRSHRKNRHAPSGEAKKRDPSYPEPAFKAEIRFLGRCMYCGGRLRLFSNTCRECGREN